MGFLSELKKNRGKIPAPTDLEILEYVYNKYYDDFIAFDRNTNKIRITKNFVPLDIEKIAKHFQVDRDIIFSRFYYVFKEKYDYKKENGHNVSFFLMKLSEEGRGELNLINFPYMTSILAELREKNKKDYLHIKISAIAVIIALISLISPYIKPLIKFLINN